MSLRGADLRKIRERALQKLNALNISTTLVVTLKKGVNDHEIGKILDFAVQQPAVRGVTFQPIQHAGRAENFDPAVNRLTLTEVRRRILEQSSIFRPEDMIPVPCHPDALAMAYALKLGDKVTPLSGSIDPQILIEGGRNTILLEQDPAIQAGIFKLFATNPLAAVRGAQLISHELLCCLPKVLAPNSITYENVFRVLIVQFIDAFSFDVRSVKKTCIHIVHPGQPSSFHSTRSTCFIATASKRNGSPRCARWRSRRSSVLFFVKFPVLIHVGPWTIDPHVFFVLLAYATGLALFLWLRRRGERRAISRSRRWAVVAAA